MEMSELRLERDGVRVYTEYRPDGKGGRRFAGYLVDNGKDRIQVPHWLGVLRLLESYGVTGVGSTTDPYDRARYRVDATPALAMYRDELLYEGWDEPEHFEWVATAPLPEL